MVRVFDLCVELFQTFWKVVDSVPTYGSHPENCGFKLVPKAQKDWTLVSSRVACSRACTGTRLVLYGTRLMVVSVQPSDCTGTEPQTPQPEPRVCIFVGLVPVQGPVYWYKGAVFVQFELQGAFRDCGPFITAPTPLRAFFVLEPEEEKAFGTFDTFHVIRHEDLVLVTGHMTTCHCAHSHMLGGDDDYHGAIRLGIGQTAYGWSQGHRQPSVSNCPLGTIFNSSHAPVFWFPFRAFCTGGGTGSRQGDRIAS
uniref:Uncharacterized protein n=1 Tax=Ananas comosus var. bracteatus TaxID=296719 RepID=A0A6V7NXK1_ANACO|nr:unnamed protein product [Ananas comosus var. bracteatus]